MQTCDRRDRSLGSGGLHPADVGVPIFGEAAAILGLDRFEHARCAGVGDDDVNRETALFAFLGQALLIVDCGAEAQATDQRDGNGSFARI